MHRLLFWVISAKTGYASAGSGAHGCSLWKQTYLWLSVGGRLYSDGSALITPEWPRRRYLTFTDHGFGLLFDRGQDQVHSMVSHAIYLGQMFFSSSLLCSYFVVDLSGKWKNSSPHTQLQIEESVQTTCRTHWLLNLVTVLCYRLHFVKLRCD